MHKVMKVMKIMKVMKTMKETRMQNEKHSMHLPSLDPSIQLFKSLFSMTRVARWYVTIP
jgi:hypothetical protein